MAAAHPAVPCLLHQSTPHSHEPGLVLSAVPRPMPAGGRGTYPTAPASALRIITACRRTGLGNRRARGPALQSSPPVQTGLRERHVTCAQCRERTRVRRRHPGRRHVAGGQADPGARSPAPALLACADCLSPVVPANARARAGLCVQLVLKEAPLSVMVGPVPIPDPHSPRGVPPR